jgi:lipid-A-disaccharide synthase
VCIDFYGFNRRVLEAAKSAGVKAFYFISPQVWASRPARVAVLRRLVDRMIVIFPFEEKLYREAGVPVSWVGHPLLDILPEPAENPPEGPLRLGLLPGSRPSEISRHLGVLLSAAGLVLRERRDSVVSVFASPHLPDIVYDDALRGFRSEGRGVRLVRDSGYQERRLQSMALTSSGTATVENALLGIPMVVIYRLSWPTYALARALIRVPHIAMANLLAGRALVPELIQGDATPQRIAQAALGILSDPPRLAALRRDLLSLRGTLGGPGAVGRAADILLREARR